MAMLCSLQNLEKAPLSWLRGKFNLLTPIPRRIGPSREPFSIPWENVNGCRWNSMATAADVSGRATSVASKSAVQTGLGLRKWIPQDFRSYLPTELITAHPKLWDFWTIQILQAFFFSYLLLCQVCLSFIVTARQPRIRQMPVVLVLLIISFEMTDNFVWLITSPTSVSITVFSLSSKSLSLEAEDIRSPMVHAAALTYTERQPTEDPRILWILWVIWRSHCFVQEEDGCQKPWILAWSSHIPHPPTVNLSSLDKSRVMCE